MENDKEGRKENMPEEKKQRKLTREKKCEEEGEGGVEKIKIQWKIGERERHKTDTKTKQETERRL